MTQNEFILLETIAETFLHTIKVKTKDSNLIGTVECVYRNGNITVANSYFVRTTHISNIELIKD